MNVSARAIGVVVCLGLTMLTLRAQEPTGDPQSLPDDLRPRTIGSRGTMAVGISGYLDKFYSSDRLMPTSYTAQVDIGRFVTNRFVVRGGLVGSGSFGGDEEDAPPSGTGFAALHAFGGLSFYLTPQSLISLYSGVEYWAQLTRREEVDAGFLVAKVGLQGALSSRASLFAETGLGIGLTKGDSGRAPTRIVGQLGVRLKL